MTATNPTRMLLVRHGETDWNRDGRLQGWAPVGLNDRGREQARRLGRFLREEYDVDRIVASDLRRARETTALLVAAGIDARPTFDAAWRERDLGVYQGFTREALHEQFPAFSFENDVFALEERPAGGERLVDAYDRTVEAWERLRTAPGGDTVLVVTHGGPITGVLAHLRGEDLRTAIDTYAVDNASLSEVRVGDDGSVSIERAAEQPPPLGE